MLPTHLRFPLLAVSTNSRQVGVACLDNHLEVVWADLHCLRRRRDGPAREEALRRYVSAALRRSGAQAIVVDGHERQISPRAAALIEGTMAALDRCAGSVRVASFREARVALKAPDVAMCLQLLVARHDLVRRRLLLRDARDRPPITRIAAMRPLIVAVALAHAAGLVSLSAEATQLSMPT